MMWTLFKGFSYLIGLIYILKRLVELLTGIWIYIVRPLFASQINWKRDYGEWAVVTGSTDGIGKEFARQLANQGMNVILLSRSLSKLQLVADEISKEFPVRTKVIPLDFTTQDPSLYKKIGEELAKYEIGLLVNNVGMFMPHPAPVDQIDSQILWDQMVVNVGATVQMTRLILPQMKERGKGGIINISAGSSIFPFPYMTTFSASKVYVDYFSQGLREECEGNGIKILNLNTFTVDTKQSRPMEKAQYSKIFIATPNQYVKSALNIFGVVDSATGYLPHAIQYAIIQIVPKFLLRKMVAKETKKMYLEHTKEK